MVGPELGVLGEHECVQQGSAGPARHAHRHASKVLLHGGAQERVQGLLRVPEAKPDTDPDAEPVRGHPGECPLPARTDPDGVSASRIQIDDGGAHRLRHPDRGDGSRVLGRRVRARHREIRRAATVLPAGQLPDVGGDRLRPRPGDSHPTRVYAARGLQLQGARLPAGGLRLRSDGGEIRRGQGPAEGGDAEDAALRAGRVEGSEHAGGTSGGARDTDGRSGLCAGI